MLRRFYSSHSQWEHLLINSAATNQELHRLYQSIHVALSTKRINRSLIPDTEFTHYQTSCTTDAQKLAFLHSLATNLGLNLRLLDDACTHWNTLRSQNHHHNNNSSSNYNSTTTPTTTSTTGTTLPLTSDDRLMRAAVRLHQASKPIFSHLWAPISQQKGGMKLLVDMRADALRLSPSSISSSSTTASSSLRPLADSIKTSLSEWFSVGMLQLRRLTWEGTPAAFLEKIVRGEAIHPYKGQDNSSGGWVDDLKRRLAVEDRRVHAFFHPAMPDEPLMVLHAALLGGEDTAPPDNINTLLDHPSSSRVVKEVQEVTHPHTAVFYSISSLQPGLQGIQMGDYLIKLVSHQLLQEFPTTLKTLITLSPIPNFSKWLKHHYKCGTLKLPSSVLAMGRKEMDVLINAYAGESYTSVIEGEEEEEENGGGEDSSSSSRRALFWWALNSHCWMSNKQIEAIIKPAVMHLAARYLAIEKRRGFALDPVANFHLRNGAELHNLVWRAATPSPSTTSHTSTNRVMDQSYGIMANYLYRLEDVAKNNAEYLEKEIIAVGEQVKEMLQK